MMSLYSPVFSVIHGFVVSLKVNSVCNCRGSTRECRVFHLRKSLGLYEDFFWANSKCKLKVIVTDAKKDSVQLQIQEEEYVFSEKK